MLNLQNGVLLRHKKEWSTTISYNVDEPRKHHAKWKEADTKGHILYDFFSMKIPE